MQATEKAILFLLAFLLPVRRPKRWSVAYEGGPQNNWICSFKRLFFWSSVNNRGTNFAERRFIFKSSVNIRWHEIQDKPVISEISSALIALRTLSRFSSFRQVECRPYLGWSSHDISPPLKRECHLYTWVLLKASSLKASCSTQTVSATDFPNRKQNFMHTLCSLLSAIIKIAQLPSRHLEKKPQQQ